MNKTYNLERVIRRVRQDVQPTRDSEKLVIIDIKQGRAIEKVGLLNFSREFRYFIVSNSDDPNNEAYGNIQLTYGGNYSNERTVEININYKAWCVPGRERQIAEALYQGADLGDTLNGMISRWVLEKINSRNGSFMTSNTESKSYLEADIRTKALMEIGLSLQVDFQIRLPWIPPALIKDSFPVRVKDYDRDEDLIVNIELDADQEAYQKALEYKEAALGELVRIELRKYFAHTVSLYTSYYMLNDESFKQSLKLHLNDSLKHVGRKVAYFSLERDRQVPLPAESIKIQVSIAYEIAEDFEVVIIKNTVVMSLQDVVKYRVSGSPELNGWVEDQLQRHINQELIGAKSTELLTEYSSYEGSIQKKLSLAALGIGYKLEYLISKPDLEPYRWLEAIEITLDESEEEFETCIPEFFVKLSISLMVSIKIVKGTEPLLSRQQQVPFLMKKALLDITKQFMRETHPGQLYVQFSQFYRQNESSFEEGLKKRFSEILKRKFNGEIIDAVFKLGETEITEALNELQSERSSFRVLIPRNRNNPEDCFLRGHFKVRGVDQNGWNDFRRTLPNNDQIKSHLEGSIRTALENHPSALTKIRDARSLDEVKNVVTVTGESSILNDFGLKIVITNIGSDATESEKKLAERVSDSERERIEEELKLYFSNVKLMREQVRILEQQIVLIKAAGGEDKVIEDIHEKIKVLESHTPIEPVTSGLCCNVQKQGE